jgi:hypothetical protein
VQWKFPRFILAAAPALWTCPSTNAYNSITLMLPLQPVKAGPALLLTTVIMLVVAAAGCAPPLPPPVPTEIIKPQPSGAAGQAPATPSDQSRALEPAIGTPAPAVIAVPGPQVRIRLIHYRGTLARIGCCNPGFYERDEFVVIQNTGDTYQDITNWRLTNLTRGYPTFTFPPLFPCIPYDLPVLAATEEQAIADSYYSLTKNPAQSELSRFSTDTQQTKPVNEPSGEFDWSSCTPLEPLDDTPMKPAEGQQGLPVPCILYPGQTVLVFTDEVHCPTGGFSFKWGQGNIWNNEIADTAVLYNAEGEEVSRRSYLVGR